MRSTFTLISSSTSAAISKHACQVSIASKIPSLSSCISLLYASGKPLSVVSKPVNEPNTRPDLPRINSHASGFFFCGINEEPDVTRSESSKNADSPLLKKIKSSAKRERCTILIEALESNSKTWSRSETESKLLRVPMLKPRSFANASRSTA